MAIVESVNQQDKQNEQQQAQQAQRSKLVGRLLAGTPSLPAFMNDLLTVQAIVVAGTEAAGFLIERTQEGTNLKPVAHVRPDGAAEDVRTAALEAFAQIVRPCVEALKDGALLIEGPEGESEQQFCLVTLLRNDADIVAVSAVITRARDVERAQQRLVSMQLVAGYFDMYMLKRSSEAARTTALSHQNVLQMATAAATGTGFKHSATALCNELQSRTGALRVSLGWLKRYDIKLKAISHTEQFDKKQELVTVLERVMDECADQEEIVAYDPENSAASAHVTRDAANLSRREGNVVVVSVPLRRQAEIIGVLTLEFPSKTKLTPETESGLAIASELLAPQLWDRYQNDHWLIVKAAISARELWKNTVGPKYWTAKLVIAIIAAFFLFVMLYSPMYRVVAPFQFTPLDKRTVAAQFEGRIDEIATIDGKRIRAGTEVTEGMTLLRMDTRELQLELARWRSEAEKAMTEATMKRAEGKEAESQMSMQAALAARAQADLARYRIEQSEVKAPIAGVILKSAVDDKRGAPVKRGEELFEIAQRDRLRVELTVNERDIQRVKVGQIGNLATTAQPGKKFPIKVDRIVPLGEAKEGGNVFKVYATLLEEAPEWRPGVAGEARLDVERRSLAWQWTHRFIDFVRLKLWI
jgi:RND family efflux transporter MFP subunit